MKKIALLASVAVFAACGPGYLTPDEVRAHLLLPDGNISADSIGFVADDFFKAQRASIAEGAAIFIRDDSGETAAFAQGVVDLGVASSMTDAASTNAGSLGDALCAAGLVAALTQFESCSDDQNCEVTLQVDACVLRVAGDENARGKLKFFFKNQVEPEFRRAEVRVDFEAFEFSQGVNAQFFAGIIAIEITEIGDEHVEIIVTTDLDAQVRGFNRGFFNDDIIERVRITVALRFTADAGDDFARGTLEILAFVEENGQRTDSVVLSFEAESRIIDENTTLAGANLSIRGSNGAFFCNWSAASEEHDNEVSTYRSSGECFDEASGETFTWDDRIESPNS